ncbi:MAG: diacylglycerol kinase family protein [Mycoplasma sp.]
MTKTGKQYWFKKFIYAFKGIFSAIKEEKSMVVHLFVAIATIGLSIGLKISAVSWIGIIVSICLVIATELINTAIENLVDLVSFEYNINAQKIKDTSAAATLVTSICAIVIALLIFIPRIMEITNGNY